MTRPGLSGPGLQVFNCTRFPRLPSCTKLNILQNLILSTFNLLTFQSSRSTFESHTLTSLCGPGGTTSHSWCRHPAALGIATFWRPRRISMMNTTFRPAGMPARDATSLLPYRERPTSWLVLCNRPWTSLKSRKFLLTRAHPALQY